MADLLGAGSIHWPLPSATMFDASSTLCRKDIGVEEVGGALAI